MNPSDRERSWPWALAAIVLALVGAWVNLRRPLAPALPMAPTDLESFAPEVLATVDAYRGTRLAAALTTTALAVVVPILVVLLPVGRRLIVGLVPDDARPLRRAALLAVVVTALTRAVRAPVGFVINHGREVEWGFRNDSAVGWWRDWALGMLVEVVVAAVAGAAFVWLVRRWPQSWHWRAVVAGTGLAVALGALYPLLVQPLFLPTQPLADGPVAQRLNALVARTDVDAPILVGDASQRTTRVNAFVTGIGPTERIVLWDNLLDRPIEEVEAVLAHELAHRENADLGRGILLSAVGLLPFMWALRWLLAQRAALGLVGASSASSSRVVALLAAAAAVGQLVGLPSALAVSRRAEAAADHRAVALTGDAEPLVRSFRGFVVRDLASPEGSLVHDLLFASHPDLTDRIRAAVANEEDPSSLPTLAEFQEREDDLRHARIGRR